MHYYLACHPTVYAFFVATIACELLHQHRDSDDREAVRACVELSMQSYNTKFHLPAGELRQFAHLECFSCLLMVWPYNVFHEK